MIEEEMKELDSEKRAKIRKLQKLVQNKGEDLPPPEQVFKMKPVG